MSGRPIKNTVDFFPHYVNNGKTMFILQNKFGNDGYAVWFKLLELLSKTENHYFYCRNATDREFLLATMGVSMEVFDKIQIKNKKITLRTIEIWLTAATFQHPLHGYRLQGVMFLRQKNVNRAATKSGGTSVS